MVIIFKGGEKADSINVKKNLCIYKINKWLWTSWLIGEFQVLYEFLPSKESSSKYI